MQTRRTFLGSVGAAAALGVTGGRALGGGTGSGDESSTKENDAERSSADRAAAASGEKMLFWVAASTPCDKDLKFDPELYKDLLAYLKTL